MKHFPGSKRRKGSWSSAWPIRRASFWGSGTTSTRQHWSSRERRCSPNTHKSCTASPPGTKHTAVLVAMEASLDSKWKAELEHLAAVFQETNQAQLEALESELSVGHKNERDELERRMLSNMDTLEATYLKEVQVSGPQNTSF